jgi:hypothetical protein
MTGLLRRLVGIQNAKVFLHCVVGGPVYTPGATNGSGKTVRKKRLPSVSEYLPVRTIRFDSTPSNQLSEQFDTRSIRWSPDGKGLVLMDKDTFCCAFEVSDEDEPMLQDN